MKKVFIVWEYAFETREDAKVFAIALISAHKVKSNWMGDSWHYSNNYYLSSEDLQISIQEKTIYDNEEESKEAGKIEIMKKKMWVFDKEQATPNTDIPF